MIYSVRNWDQIAKKHLYSFQTSSYFLNFFTLWKTEHRKKIGSKKIAVSVQEKIDTEKSAGIDPWKIW